jgi:protein-L-isoaspartate O-methyltransferase
LTATTNAELFINLKCMEIICLYIFYLFYYCSVTKIIRSNKDFDIMLEIDRGFYAPKNPYHDAPQALGHGINLSAPQMHAHALELLKDHLNEGGRGLDIACGAGYLTACMAVMVKFKLFIIIIILISVYKVWN